MNTLPNYLIWPTTGLKFKKNTDDSYTPYVNETEYELLKNNKYMKYSFEYLVMICNCKNITV